MGEDYMTNYTKLEDLFDISEFNAAVEDRYVRVRKHPELDYSIANYAEKTVFEKLWTPVTLQCRGLIFDNETLEIIARPWPKFFNLGEHGTEIEGLKAASRIEVTDKMDGSLGIAYFNPDTSGWDIATRGSFTSEQALRGTEILHKQYPYFDPDIAYTYLFEIIYPENRIVLDYEGREELVLLGGVEIATGYTKGPKSPDLKNWGGARASIYPMSNLGTAMTMAPRKNAEGFVVRFLDTDLMVKIKQEDYCRAHAIVTGCSNRSIWETLSKGESLPEKAAFMPDEFHAWMVQTAFDLNMARGQWAGKARQEFKAILDHCSDDFDRKEFASFASKNPFSAALFKLYDAQDINDLAWKAVRPVEIVRPFTRSEDVA